ncbi:FAD-binding oxidoreductase [Chitinophaga agrisoli]|uniref:FAD-binding oxidoreductase n=1 Tax=Chitinophaga agrisoli TaxID=2607653 RepID=A0A5B2W497_9BACT|nr:FAD-binding oxidoreductase [Chitinophaga agrisoli]KAA2245257.1 FAD-binding oxidoreductase [Chitinophaga agrisoli]
MSTYSPAPHTVTDTVAGEKIASFKASLRGELIEPDHADYDTVRKVYNGMIDRHPRFIARCTDVADVVNAVNFCRENQLLTAVRSGGHNGAGLGMCDDGLVIDLSPMKGITVDPAAQTAWVEAGCTLGDLDKAVHPFGLATPSGIISTTGVGGITLGGGLGHLTRKYGLAIDNVLSASVVLADGSFVKASPTENEDLFWAIRGGGGNFGVITSFVFRLHTLSQVYGGPMLWEMDQAVDVLKWYREFIVIAPEALNGFFAFMTVPPAPPFPEHLHNKKMCGVVWAYAGPAEKAEALLDPIYNRIPPALDLLGYLPVPALNSMFDGLYPPGLQWYWKGDYVNEISDAAIEAHVKYGEQLPSMHSTMHLYPINGATRRVGDSETAWAYRKANWAQVIVGVDPDPANRDAITTWAKDYWEALHPYSAGGSYINFMMEEGEERIKATYGNNYDRLVAVKNKYDPGNLFCVNQNIKPTVV